MVATPKYHSTKEQVGGGTSNLAWIHRQETMSAPPSSFRHIRMPTRSLDSYCQVRVQAACSVQGCRISTSSVHICSRPHAPLIRTALMVIKCNLGQLETSNPPLH